MRISDWSSDVCSSDLWKICLSFASSIRFKKSCNERITAMRHFAMNDSTKAMDGSLTGCKRAEKLRSAFVQIRWSKQDEWTRQCVKRSIRTAGDGWRVRRHCLSRKSVGSGKGVAVRVDLGGRSSYKK